MQRTYNVLFLCTRNSARSILAEAILNYLPTHTITVGHRFVGYSAGSEPAGAVHPMALELLSSQGMPTSNLRSKSWDEFSTIDAPDLDFVITLCDQAAQEPCPAWPGQPLTAHWGVRDPAAPIPNGGEDNMRRVFLDAYTLLKRRIELLTSLPMDKLDRLTLEQKVRGFANA